jgi:protein gp37
MDTRLGQAQWGAGKPRIRTSAHYWSAPRAWNKRAQRGGVRERVFCASLADVFDNEIDQETSGGALWRPMLFSLIRETPHLDWLLLTKRIGNAKAMLPPDWGTGYDNVWLGATIVNQLEAHRDIPKLLAVPARIRFLSMEPLLGPVTLPFSSTTSWCPVCEDIMPDTLTYPHEVSHGDQLCAQFDPSRHCCDVASLLHWVIAGGESGSCARPMHPDWASSLRDQCQNAGVAFLFKQWGEWEVASVENGHYGSVMPDSGDRFTWVTKNGKTFNPSAPEGGDSWAMARVGKKKAGRLLDGRTWDELPMGAV